jgi:hypothetical protein
MGSDVLLYVYNMAASRTIEQITCLKLPLQRPVSDDLNFFFFYTTEMLTQYCATWGTSPACSDFQLEVQLELERNHERVEQTGQKGRM